MTYSTDFRQLALQKIEQGLSVRQAAQEMGIVRATLRGWIKNPIPKGYPKQRKCRKISREALLQDVAEYPDAYHDERAQRFGCSAAAIGKALKKWNISRKKDPQSSETQ